MTEDSCDRSLYIHLKKLAWREPLRINFRLKHRLSTQCASEISRQLLDFELNKYIKKVPSVSNHSFPDKPLRKRDVNALGSSVRSPEPVLKKMRATLDDGNNFIGFDVKSCENLTSSEPESSSLNSRSETTTIAPSSFVISKELLSLCNESRKLFPSSSTESRENVTSSTKSSEKVTSCIKPSGKVTYLRMNSCENTAENNSSVKSTRTEQASKTVSYLRTIRIPHKSKPDELSSCNTSSPSVNGLPINSSDESSCTNSSEVLSNLATSRCGSVELERSNSPNIEQSNGGKVKELTLGHIKIKLASIGAKRRSSSNQNRENMNSENKNRESINNENINRESNNSENINREGNNSENINREDNNSENINREGNNSENINREGINSENINHENINRKDTNSENINCEDINCEDINCEDINREDTNSENTNSESINSESINSEDINSENINREDINCEKIPINKPSESAKDHLDKSESCTLQLKVVNIETLTTQSKDIELNESNVPSLQCQDQIEGNNLESNPPLEVLSPEESPTSSSSDYDSDGSEIAFVGEFTKADKTVLINMVDSGDEETNVANKSGKEDPIKRKEKMSTVSGAEDQDQRVAVSDNDSVISSSSDENEMDVSFSDNPILATEFLQCEFGKTTDTFSSPAFQKSQNYQLNAIVKVKVKRLRPIDLTTTFCYQHKISWINGASIRYQLNTLTSMYKYNAWKSSMNNSRKARSRTPSRSPSPMEIVDPFTHSLFGPLIEHDQNKHKRSSQTHLVRVKPKYGRAVANKTGGCAVYKVIPKNKEIYGDSNNVSMPSHDANSASARLNYQHNIWQPRTMNLQKNQDNLWQPGNDLQNNRDGIWQPYMPASSFITTPQSYAAMTSTSNSIPPNASFFVVRPSGAVNLTTEAPLTANLTQNARPQLIASNNQNIPTYIPILTPVNQGSIVATPSNSFNAVLPSGAIQMLSSDNPQQSQPLVYPNQQPQQLSTIIQRPAVPPENVHLNPSSGIQTITPYYSINTEDPLQESSIATTGQQNADYYQFDIVISKLLDEIAHSQNFARCRMWQGMSEHEIYLTRSFKTKIDTVTSRLKLFIKLGFPTRIASISNAIYQMLLALGSCCTYHTLKAITRVSYTSLGLPKPYLAHTVDAVKLPIISIPPIVPQTSTLNKMYIVKRFVFAVEKQTREVIFPLPPFCVPKENTDIDKITVVVLISLLEGIGPGLFVFPHSILMKDFRTSVDSHPLGKMWGISAHQSGGLTQTMIYEFVNACVKPYLAKRPQRYNETGNYFMLDWWWCLSQEQLAALLPGLKILSLQRFFPAYMDPIDVGVGITLQRVWGELVKNWTRSHGALLESTFPKFFLQVMEKIMAPRRLQRWAYSSGLYPLDMIKCSKFLDGMELSY